MFESREIRQAYLSQYNTELRPPKNWKEFNAIARFFTRSFNPQSPLEFGTTLGALNFTGAVSEFLPRKWSYETDMADHVTAFSLNNAGAVQALVNYKESFSYAAPNSPNQWWDKQVDLFASGSAAMMMLYVAHATKLTDRKTSKVIGNIACAPVPGNTPVLGGWSLGINTQSANKEGAWNFIKWLTGENLSVPHTILGGSAPSNTLFHSSELLNLYPWLHDALESFPMSRKRLALELPDGRMISELVIEEILGQAIHDYLSDRSSPEDALASAEQKLLLIERNQ